MNDKRQPVKKNMSSMQVLKTLLVLLEGNYTMSEIVDKLNENESDSIFNNSVVSKYINTCRYSGIEISKIHNKYFVSKLPFGIDLTSEEYELLAYMKRIASENFSKSFNDHFEQTANKFERFINRQIVKINEGVVNLTEEAFKKAINNEQKIRLMLKSKTIFDCVPLGIIKHKGHKYFNIFHNDKQKMIAISRVSGFEILNEKISKPDKNIEVVYKLKGVLSEKYALREHEILIVDNKPEFIIISNKGEVMDELILRLLRYGNLCEVVTPKTYKECIKTTIDSALANYGV